jgi:hypothetical protein
MIAAAARSMMTEAPLAPVTFVDATPISKDGNDGMGRPRQP